MGHVRLGSLPRSRAWKEVVGLITAIRQRTLPGDCLLRTVYESGSVISVPAIPVEQKQPDNYFRKRVGRQHRTQTFAVLQHDAYESTGNSFPSSFSM